MGIIVATAYISLLHLHLAAAARDIHVVVALDELGAAQLSDNAFETNKHSLRALWAQHDDFWDVEMLHDCSGIHDGRCTFSSNLSALTEADAVLFSAQLFPALGRFEEIRRRLSPHTSTVLWNTEAVDTFRLGRLLPL